MQSPWGLSLPAAAEGLKFDCTQMMPRPFPMPWWCQAGPLGGAGSNDQVSLLSSFSQVLFVLFGFGFYSCSTVVSSFCSAGSLEKVGFRTYWEMKALG